MGEDQAVEPIHAASAQVRQKHTIIIARRSGIDEPVSMSAAQMDGRAGSQVERVDFQKCAARTVRMFNVKMTARDLREQTHHSQDKFRERPIRVVENHGKPG